jgi:hypothetical protein
MSRHAARCATAAITFGACLAACGGSSSDTPGDHASLDAGFGHVVHHDAATLIDTGVDPAPDAAKTPLNRMQGHQKRVLSSMRLVAVYFGEDGTEGAQSFDGMMGWLVKSDYWNIMQQYGVNAGSLVGSVRLDWHAVFAPGTKPSKMISANDLDARVYALLHPEVAPADAGDQVDGALDAGADASVDASLDAFVDASSGPEPVPQIPVGDAYIFFLPNGVNVSFDGPDGKPWATCAEAGGYHTFDGTEPYSVIPPCAFGRSAQAISHELAEMATDPEPGLGWLSDKDSETSYGGEIGDLCNQPTTVEGWGVTQLWSNKDGDCEPGL